MEKTKLQTTDHRRKKRKARPHVSAKPGARLLLRHQLLELTGTSYPTIWAWMKDGLFPLPLELGPAGKRSAKIAWLAEEIDAWIASRSRRKIGRMPRKNEYVDEAQSSRQPKAAQ